MVKLTIDERLALLEEAEQFFADLSAAGEDDEKLWRKKAAALWTVKECLELYKNKMLEWKDWTETTLEMALATVVEEDYIEKMVKINWMSEEEADFYKGWFGMAIGIIHWDEETINDLRELENQYDNIVELKAQDKTIADLLK